MFTPTHRLIAIAASLAIGLFTATPTLAGYDEHDATRACQSDVERRTDSDDFYDVQAKHKHHHDYDVTGKVRVRHGDDQEFKCRVRDKQVKEVDLHDIVGVAAAGAAAGGAMKATDRDARCKLLDYGDKLFSGD